MEDKIILTSEEITSLKDLRNKFSEISSTLGSIELQMYELSSSKTQILAKFTELKQEQEKLGTYLQNKYGKGIVDLETGELAKG